MESQISATHIELQAQQTPKDKFWSIVHWMYNCAYNVEWFKPSNDFAELYSSVADIDPCCVDQFRTKVQLQTRWQACKLSIQIMNDAYERSGQNADVLAPNNDYEGFYHLSGKRMDGGGNTHGNSGKYYVFLLSCKVVLLQDLAESVLGGNVLSSGNVLLPDGSSLNSSFLDG